MDTSKFSILIAKLQSGEIKLQVKVSQPISELLAQSPIVIVCLSSTVKYQIVNDTGEINLLEYLPKVQAFLQYKGKVISLQKLLQELTDEQLQTFSQVLASVQAREFYLLLNLLGLQAARALNLNLSSQRFLLSNLVIPKVKLVNILQ